MTTQEAAEELNCSLTTIHRYIKSGKIEAEKIKKINESNWRYEIPPKEIENLKENKKPIKSNERITSEEIYLKYVKNKNFTWQDVANIFNITKKEAIKKGFKFYNTWVKEKNNTKIIRKKDCSKCVWSMYCSTNNKKTKYYCPFNRCVKNSGWKLEKEDNNESNNKEKAG